jgi:hypothetical protein
MKSELRHRYLLYSLHGILFYFVLSYCTRIYELILLINSLQS